MVQIYIKCRYKTLFAVNFFSRKKVMGSDTCIMAADFQSLEIGMGRVKASRNDTMVSVEAIWR